MTDFAATLDTAIAACQTAIGSGDWTSARTELTRAEAALVALPDVGHGQARIDWSDRQRVVMSLRKTINQQDTAKVVADVGIRRSKITYATVSG